MKKSQKFIKLCKKYGVNPDNVKEILDYKDACKDLGYDPKARPDYSRAPKHHRNYLDLQYELLIIAEALGAGKNINYHTQNSKYSAWFRVKADKKRPAGFAFSSARYDDWNTGSDVGSRLCFAENVDAALFFARHFTKHHLATQLILK